MYIYTHTHMRTKTYTYTHKQHRTLLDGYEASQKEDEYKSRMMAMMGAAKYRTLTGDQVQGHLCQLHFPQVPDDAILFFLAARFPYYLHIYPFFYSIWLRLTGHRGYLL